MKYVIILSTLLALRASEVLAEPIDPRSPMFNRATSHGGSSADDCGDGKPVTLDEASWAANKVDDAINSTWPAGLVNPNFDFHQAFSRKYAVSLYCPNIFTECTGVLSGCGVLSGEIEEKKVGWLGVKAMVSLQEQYLQFQKAITAAADGLFVDMHKFQQVFAPPSLPERNATVNVARNGLMAAIDTMIGFAATTANDTVPVLSPIAAAGFKILSMGIAGTLDLLTYRHPVDSALTLTDFSVLTLLDTKAEFKRAMLCELDGNSILRVGV
ncbi:MAG: hypothetical protein M1813_001600 [Trichoglossum hirsutum]|nr:MAG: hypothetical protein M1813_001600 [Trichoglossum hirsutum]